jgi:squalene synthase HpnC
VNKNNTLEQAYRYCQQLAQSHYENFPVASVLLPKRLRLPISVIYAFARTADDFADEGDAPQQTRLQQLDNFSQALQQISQQNYLGDDPIFIALADVIKQHHLPLSLFDDLLSAFKQDVVKNRYESFEQVLDYCSRSANPVGRLLLHLNENPSDLQLQQSDSICTSLQLINFYQDIVQDLSEQNRLYLPSDELAQYDISEQDITQLKTDNLNKLIRLQYDRTRKIMLDGINLGAQLNGRLGWEIRAMTLGGIVTLQQLISQNNDALLSRPRLSKIVMVKIMLVSFSKRLYLKRSNQILKNNTAF